MLSAKNTIAYFVGFRCGVFENGGKSWLTAMMNRYLRMISSSCKFSLSCDAHLIWHSYVSETFKKLR